MVGGVRVVLVGTQHPGNIGSAARAMKTMGLRDLLLVAPERYPDREANALAAGADDVLDAARVCTTLDEALGDCRLVLATTARRRSVPMPEFPPAEAARRMVAAQREGTDVALVFGRERTGLENDELQRCHAAIRIPANPDYSSLNLAAAVQVLAYAWRVEGLDAGLLASDAQALPASDPGPGTDADDRPATHAELEGFFEHLGRFLDAIDFHKGKAPDMVTQRLRRLFMRAQPDPRELRILRGILSDAQRQLR